MGATTQDSNSRISPIALAAALLIAVAALSTAAPFFRQAAPTHPLAQAAFRLAIACICLLPFLLRAIGRGVANRRFWFHGAAAGGFYALHFGTWVTSLTLTSVASSVTLVTATPVILAIWAVLTNTDRPSRRTWFALFVCAVGMTVIGSHDLGLSAEHFVGDALALAGAFAMAGYLLVARNLGRDLDLFAFLAIATGAGALLLYVLCLASGVDPRPASPMAATYLVLAALLPQLVGHGILTWALRHTTPTTVGITTVGEPVGASILAWIWLGESVGFAVATGAALTLSGVILAITAPRPSRPTAPTVARASGEP